MARGSRWAALGLPAACAALGGCATPKLLCLRPDGVQSVTIHSSSQANGGVPVAVDLVFVTQKPPAQTISKLTASDYYLGDSRNQLERDNPDAVKIHYWELPAGYTIKTQVKPPCNIVKTFIFASYASNGPHRVELTKAKQVTVELGTDDFTTRQ